MKREPIPKSQVIEWLKTTHENLLTKMEPEREWIWLAVDLRGDQNKPVRDSLVEFGFKYAARGHKLPSGANGTWAHPCSKPIAFKFKGKKSKSKGGQPRRERDDSDSSRIDPLEEQESQESSAPSPEFDEAAAYFARL